MKSACAERPKDELPRPMKRVAGTLIFGVVLLGGPTRAAFAGESTHACVQAAHEGQSLRDAGKLTAARSQFLACGAASCPEVVRGSCERWGAEVDARIPTLVLVARDDKGGDISGVRASVDGKVVADALDGRSIAVDPGAHELTFETPGRKAARQFVIAREGEKVRPIVVVMPEGSSNEVLSPSMPPSSAPTRLGAPPSNDDGRRAPSVVPPLVAGGITVLGVGGFVLFGALGKSEKDRLEESCSATKTCASSDVSAARTKLVVADVSLVVGVVAGVFTGVLLVPFFKGDGAPKKSASSFGFTPTANGAFAAFEHRY